MTTTLKAHFDGKVLVPEGPVDLPVGQVLSVQILEATDQPRGLLARLANLAETFPEDPDSPRDGAAQHDHYLYGVPKKP